ANFTALAGAGGRRCLSLGRRRCEYVVTHCTQFIHRQLTGAMKLFSGMRSLLGAGLLASFITFPRNSHPLDLGDAAPAVKIAEWIKGGPVSLDIGKGTNILVLDFWDMDVNQCRYTIPYLSNLQKKFNGQGIFIAGITSNPADKAKKFLSSLGSPVEYAMAIDAKGQTSDAYLKGVGWDELPHSFVIDKHGK